MMNRVRLDRRRWLAVGLLASLALNAFFIGAAATDVLQAPSTGHTRGTSLVRYEVRWMKNLLPEGAMDEVMAVFDSDGRPKVEAHIERLRTLRADLGKIIAEPVVDQARVDAQLALIREEIDVMLAETQTIITDTLISLPTETRSELAGSSEPTG